MGTSKTQYTGRAKPALNQSKDATYPTELSPLDTLLLEAAKNLDNDKKFSDSMAKANDVLLAMFFNLGEPQGKPDKPLPDYTLRNNLVNVKDASGSGAQPLPSRSVLSPIPALGSKALSIGHLNSFPDVDGAVRTEPLVVGYYSIFR